MKSYIGYQIIQKSHFATAVAVAWPVLDNETTNRSAWLEAPLCPDGLRLRDNDMPLTEAQELIDIWTEGRLFGPLGELRWEAVDDTHVHLVLITDAAHFPDSYQGQACLEPQRSINGEEELLFLWGRYSEAKGWSEDRIPELRYPDNWKGPYAAIRMCRYELLATDVRPYDSIVVRYLGYKSNISM